MSRPHIRQELSELETDLRKEIGVLLETEQQAFNFTGCSLSELIDKLTEIKLSEHPLYHKLLRLDAAACQLDLGLYGLCSDCEAEIETQRLLSDPTEQRCASCAEHHKHEHGLELRLSH